MMQCNFIKTQTEGCGYKSCIKVRGVPILPPLITLEKRQELEDDRKKAIELEKHLQTQRDLKIVVEGPIPPHFQAKTQPVPPTNSSPITRTLANCLTFGNDESHDALNVSDKPKNSDRKLPSRNCKRVPSPERKRKPSKLTCNIFDVSQYSNDGVVLFNKRSPLNKPFASLQASMVELDLTSLCCGGHECGDACNNKNKKPSPLLSAGTARAASPSKPRLLRSNSYTLESPSPVLLEHFKKQAELESGKSLRHKRRSLDLTSRDSTSFNESAYKTCTWRSREVNRSSLPSDATVSDLDHSVQSGDKEDEHINENTLKGCDISVESISSIVENLAQLHFGTNESEAKDIQKKEDCLHSTLPDDVQTEHEHVHWRVAEAEAALHEVLNDIPENYAKDIMELLERHKLEQEIKLESYAKFKQKLLDENVNMNGLTLPTYNASNDNTVEEPEECPRHPLLHQEEIPKDVSSYDDESKSCTIDCLMNSPTDTLNALNTSASFMDLESDTEPLIYFDCKSSLYKITSEQSLRASRSAGCSRELFAEKSNKMERQLKEQWAAEVLTAAAKGYLVRRLKRTERVKNLIQTIRDALLCAMSLHTESAEVIQPSDVELHRRLIQQVSAACYEFYDIFFTLTTKEQMAMIALDRQRLQEKLKRPLSSSSLKMDSSRSSRDSSRSFNTRQKKNLTPSFAA